MQISLHWRQAVAFEATTESGHSFLIDGAPVYGGENRGPRPMETLLSGAAACSAIDVVHILKKSKQQITDLKVEVTAKRAQTEPTVFTHIHLCYNVYGPDSLRSAAVDRAIELSVNKYCSALRMLSATCKIDYSWKKVDLLSS